MNRLRQVSSRNCFSARERECIQNAVALIGVAVPAVLAIGVIAYDGAGRELMRNQRAREVLEVWFGRAESRGPGVPPILREPLQAFMARLGTHPPAPIELPHPTTPSLVLQASFTSLRLSGARGWYALVLEVRGHTRGAPPDWHMILTRRELEVAQLVRNGWSNEVIASELGCSAATVKKHVQRILDKLGIDNRMALIAESDSSTPSSRRLADAR